MGNFYTNIVLVGADASAVIKYLADSKRAAYVFEGGRAMTVVYDQICDTQDVTEIHSLGADLTKVFDCSAVACLNHDDDALFLSAYRGGQLLTEYDSSVGRHLHPVQLCRAARVSVLRTPIVFALLVLPNPLYAIFKHMAIATALRLPKASVGSGYEYIDSGEPPTDSSCEPLHVVHTLNPDKPPPRIEPT